MNEEGVETPAPGSDWDGERFVKADFAGLDLRRCRFDACEFVDCTFTDANLTEAVFDDCSWLRCELSNCKVQGARFRKAEFVGCRMRGVSFSECHGFVLEFEFTDCNLSYSSFSGLRLPRTVFKDCKLNETDFAETQLMESSFEGSDLNGTTFHHTDLSDCDLSGARHVCVDLQNNRVKGMKLSLDGAFSTLAAVGVEVKL